MIKRLVALPFIAFALVAAKDEPPAKPAISVNPPAEIAADPANRWSLELSNGGKVVILLRPDVAPQHVYRIQQLTSQGFYNGLTFHRVIPGFMAQGGDPRGTGEGGSPLPDLAAEFNDLPHLRGVASMARAQEPNSANSQFFIMLAPRFALDHKYSAFGRVIEGMAAVDGIAVGEPPEQPTRIVRATIGGPLPAPPPVAASAVVDEAALAASAAATAVAAAPASAPEETAAAAPAEVLPEQPAPVEPGPNQDPLAADAAEDVPDETTQIDETADEADEDALLVDGDEEVTSEEAPTPQ